MEIQFNAQNAFNCTHWDSKPHSSVSRFCRWKRSLVRKLKLVWVVMEKRVCRWKRSSVRRPKLVWVAMMERRVCSAIGTVSSVSCDRSNANGTGTSYRNTSEHNTILYSEEKIDGESRWIGKTVKFLKIFKYVILKKRKNFTELINLTVFQFKLDNQTTNLYHKKAF